MTISGGLNVQGELTLHDKATIVQQENSYWNGNGAVHVQQWITGSGSTTPTGRLIKSLVLTEQETSFSLTESTGVYFVQVQTPEAFIRQKITLKTN